MEEIVEGRGGDWGEEKEVTGGEVVGGDREKDAVIYRSPTKGVNLGWACQSSRRGAGRE